MDADTFVTRIAEHPDLGLVHVDGGTETAYVTNARTGLTYSLAVRGVVDAPEDQLFAILEGRRNPVALEHWSRIVGYFSQIEHWNKSKLGELADRRAAKAFYSEGLGPRLGNDAPLGPKGGAPVPRELPVPREGPRP